MVSLYCYYQCYFYFSNVNGLIILHYKLVFSLPKPKIQTANESYKITSAHNAGGRTNLMTLCQTRQSVNNSVLRGIWLASLIIGYRSKIINH